MFYGGQCVVLTPCSCCCGAEDENNMKKHLRNRSISHQGVSWPRWSTRGQLGVSLFAYEGAAGGRKWWEHITKHKEPESPRGGFVVVFSHKAFIHCLREVIILNQLTVRIFICWKQLPLVSRCWVWAELKEAKSLGVGDHSVLARNPWRHLVIDRITTCPCVH